jgi:DNA-binding transcriptional LysR family regulator
VSIAALREEVWADSEPNTGHHALVLSTCRSLGGFEPDLRHHSNDADVQLELVRAASAVALMPALTLPPGDSALAVRDIAEAVIRRRLVVITRESPVGPALDAFLAAVRNQGQLLAHQGRSAA